MKRLVMTCCLATLITYLGGCGGQPAYEGSPRAAIKGKVTFGGEPVENGAISLIPESDKSRRAGGLILKGEYSITEPNGPNLGAYRVEVRWPKATGKKIVESDSGAEIDEMKEAVPSKFNEKTELTIEIKNGLNEKNWDLAP